MDIVKKVVYKTRNACLQIVCSIIYSSNIMVVCKMIALFYVNARNIFALSCLIKVTGMIDSEKIEDLKYSVIGTL